MGAQQAAQQALANQLNLAQRAPQLAGQQISALTTLGGIQQAANQQQLAAQQQLAQQQLQQPLTAAGQLGSGIASLISGYPGQISIGQQVVPSPLQTAISGGATLAGIYRAFGN
jgi:16S rRNA G1207 methylase RsmC